MHERFDHDLLAERRARQAAEDTTPIMAEVVTDTTDALAADEQVQAVIIDPFAERRGTLYKLQQAIYLLFGVIEGLIAIRFVLMLLGANPVAGFVSFIYAVTGPLVAPFAGIFPELQTGSSVLEPQAIVAIVVYLLCSWLLVKLLWLMLGETRSGVSTSTRRTRTRVQ